MNFVWPDIQFCKFLQKLLSCLKREKIVFRVDGLASHAVFFTLTADQAIHAIKTRCSNSVNGKTILFRSRFVEF